MVGFSVESRAGDKGGPRVVLACGNRPVAGAKRHRESALKVRVLARRFICRDQLSDHAWYFPSPEGTRWDPDNFSSDLRVAQRAAGLRWTCLHFRHTFGSQLAQKGVSLYKISTLMGNSPEICRRHYAALLPESLSPDVEFHSEPSLADAALSAS